MARIADLWGGRLLRISFDPVSHSCDLHITTTFEGRGSAYVIACRQVNDLRFRNAIPGPWEYAEVTEVHLGTDERSGRYVLELVLWSEDAELVIVCAGIELRESSR